MRKVFCDKMHRMNVRQGHCDEQGSVRNLMREARYVRKEESIGDAKREQGKPDYVR